MATKTIVRWKPSSPLYGERRISVADFEREGIFTQRRDLVWSQDRGFWLAADDAEISKEALEWLVNHPDATGSFTSEEQEVSEEAVRPQSAPTGSPQPEGESASTSQSTAAAANTTTSTAATNTGTR